MHKSIKTSELLSRTMSFSVRMRERYVGVYAHECYVTEGSSIVVEHVDTMKSIFQAT